MSTGGAEEKEEDGLGLASNGAEEDGMPTDANVGEEEDFDLYGDIDMDLVSSRPINQPAKDASNGSQPSTSGRYSANLGQQNPPRLVPQQTAPNIQHTQASANLSQASRVPNLPLKPPPPAPTVSPAAEASSKPVPRSETGAGPLPHNNVTGPATVQAAPKAPLTSAALASEYMARHGLGPGGAQAAQPQLHRPPPQAGKETTQVYVGELNWWTSDEEIERALGEYGRVKELRLFEEKANGKFKGYCQAEFFDGEAARACKEMMSGRLFTGRPCVVTYVAAARPRYAGEGMQGGMGAEQESRGAGGGGRGAASRTPAGRAGLAEAGPGSTRAPGPGREAQGRGGYMGGRGMEYPMMGAQGWDVGFGGSRGGYSQNGGWGRGPYQQWGGPEYGAGRGMGPEYWEREGPPGRGPYGDGPGKMLAGGLPYVICVSCSLPRGSENMAGSFSGLLSDGISVRSVRGPAVSISNKICSPPAYDKVYDLGRIDTSIMESPS
jgi:hypothetical protein